MKNVIQTYAAEKGEVTLHENNLVFVRFHGDADDAVGEWMWKVNEDVLKITEGKLHVLVDLSNAGKSTPGARAMWKKLSSHERTHKVAMFGMHPVARVLAAFMVGRTGRDNIAFFTTKEKALQWIFN